MFKGFNMFNINKLSKKELIQEIVQADIEQKTNVVDFLQDYYDLKFTHSEIESIFLEYGLDKDYIHADSYIETDKHLMGPL